MIKITDLGLEIHIPSDTPEELLSELRSAIIGTVKNQAAYTSDGNNPDPDGHNFYLLTLLEEMMDVKTESAPKASEQISQN